MKQLFLVMILSLALVSCKSKDSKNKETKNADTTVATNVSYNFAGHGDINVFIDDLAKAVTAGDKMAIAQMTSFPFVDQWPQFATGNEKVSPALASLAAADSAEFIVRFDNLFIPDLVNAIKIKKYRAWEKNEHVPDIIEEGEYLIMADAPINKRQYALAIKKINGVYKIYRTAFSS